MADFQDHNILNYKQDFEYDLRGDTLLGPRDQEEEPMEQGGYDSDVHIQEEEEVQPHSPAESPAEQQEENLFGCRGTDIFEQDDPPAPSPQSSLCSMSQLIHDINLKMFLHALQKLRPLFNQPHWTRVQKLSRKLLSL